MILDKLNISTFAQDPAKAQNAQDAPQLDISHLESQDPGGPLSVEKQERGHLGRPGS